MSNTSKATWLPVGSDVEELTLMRTRERLQRRDPISFSDLFFDLDREVGEGLPDVLEELEAILLVPGLAGTRRAVDEVIRRKFLADFELVTALELLDETANDALVLILGHGSTSSLSAMAAYFSLVTTAVASSTR